MSRPTYIPSEIRITAEEAAAFRARWRAVTEALQEELRSLSIEAKRKQLNALLLLASQIDWVSRADDSEVRERWQRIRAAPKDCGERGD